MANIDFFDPLSAAIVLIGTLGAALLRCGWRDMATALRSTAQLLAPAFDSSRVRAELALQVQEIEADGLYRAQPHRFGDGEFDHLSEALIRNRSIQNLFDEHGRYRQVRAAAAQTAGRVLGDAAELAPVLGLAGTLLALGALSGASGDQSFASQIGSAVTTTLYGLVAAHFLFAPLAAAVGRKARAEESARTEVLEWLAAALSRTGGHKRPANESRAAA